ncbi:MAG: tetratricopeptide repeat protein [Hyphomonadaceae bacterium]|nr:tetratricopeptide repeat protein [Hyphomonadaceae bacterium]
MSRLPFALLAVSALAACATTGEGAGGQATQQNAVNAPAPRGVDRAARERIGREDMLTQMAFWASEYNTFPNDLEAAQRFAESLRLGGRNDRAVQTAGEALRRFPDDKPLLLTFGLAQLGQNNAQAALRPLALVAASDPQNWRARSALGVALDQLGRYDEARQAYQEALALRPNDPAVLTNLGMSHLISGDPAEAEQVLRQAVSLPGAPPQARLNLAVAVALQGRFDEAERLERADLPAAAAQSNMTYLRGLLSDPRSWRDLGGSRS